MASPGDRNAESQATVELVFFSVCVDDSVELGLLEVPAGEPFRMAQKIAHGAEKTADLLGIHKAMIGPQK